MTADERDLASCAESCLFLVGRGDVIVECSSGTLSAVSKDGLFLQAHLPAHLLELWKDSHLETLGEREALGIELLTSHTWSIFLMATTLRHNAASG